MAPMTMYQDIEKKYIKGYIWSALKLFKPKYDSIYTHFLYPDIWPPDRGHGKLEPEAE
jgi:hypothetical protein